MYYDKQDIRKQEAYKNMLTLVGMLSRLFSTADEPFLYYRAHENIFAKYFELDNNARNDDSADACDLKNKIGFGLKTWVGGDNQKVAEFGLLRPQYEHLHGLELIKQIAKYRNLRIRTTLRQHGLNELIYHIVKRIPGAMCIYESAFDYIDIDNIVYDEHRGSENNLYFSDGKHTYHFSLSKNTLYMIFDDMTLLDQFPVNIVDDPYSFLENNMSKTETTQLFSMELAPEQLCLKLYSVKSDGTKFVPEKSGLNQWNGVRVTYLKDKTGKDVYDENGDRVIKKITPRDPNELYIPFPAEDRARIPDFFPPKDTPFDLCLPDGQWISAKVCQQDSKAIMSNPNKKLGKWLLRDVLELPEGTVITYEMLQQYGIDSVIFTKIEDLKYSIDFCPLETYESFYESAAQDD